LPKAAGRTIGHLSRGILDVFCSAPRHTWRIQYCAITLVFLFVFFLGWLFSNEDIGSHRPIRRFSRGGFVSSALFDHTSVVRFLERRFGAEVPDLSAWRRATVGDLTSAFNFRKPDQSIPALPSTLPAIPQILAECAARR